MTRSPGIAYDFTGLSFGHWSVLDRAPKRGAFTYWLCRCVCGTERAVKTSSLAGGYRSCSCRGAGRKPIEIRPKAESRRGECGEFFYLGVPCVTDGGGAVAIPLAGGRGVTWIDEADFNLVAQYFWYGRSPAVKHQYAKTGRTIVTASGHKTKSLHRALIDAPPDALVDHVDGDGLNNRRRNIRLANAAQNTVNRQRFEGFGGYRGVMRHGPSFGARIRFENRISWLGVYATPEAAARAYDLAAIGLHGEFAVLNFPDRAGGAP